MSKILKTQDIIHKPLKIMGKIHKIKMPNILNNKDNIHYNKDKILNILCNKDKILNIHYNKDKIPNILSNKDKIPNNLSNKDKIPNILCHKDKILYNKILCYKDNKDKSLNILLLFSRVLLLLVFSRV